MSSCGYLRSVLEVVLDAITTGFDEFRSYPCASIAPNPVTCASIMMNIFFVSKYRNNVSCLTLCTRFSKQFWSIDVHSKLAFLCVNFLVVLLSLQSFL